MVKIITLALQLTGAVMTSNLRSTDRKLDSIGQDRECTNVTTNIKHTGTWSQINGQCVAPCGGNAGVQAVTWECLDKDSNVLPLHLCEKVEDQITQQPCTTDTVEECPPCVIDFDAYWYLDNPLEDPAVPRNSERSFDCTNIPNYPLMGVQAKFACSAEGVLTEVKACDCVTRGRATKKNGKKVDLIDGDWADVHASQQITGDTFLTLADSQVVEDGKNFDLTISEPYYGAGTSLHYFLKDSTTKIQEDSIVNSMAPMDCMKLCIAHNAWRSKNDNEDGCIVAVPEYPQADHTKCRLRKKSIAEYDSNDTNMAQDTYSYDMKCMIDRLNEPDSQINPDLQDEQKDFWTEAKGQTMQ